MRVLSRMHPECVAVCFVGAHREEGSLGCGGACPPLALPLPLTLSWTREQLPVSCSLGSSLLACTLDGPPVAAGGGWAGCWNGALTGPGHKLGRGGAAV